uniref:SSD domain-containing protein n=1 Tax=Meloidogyne hapla TaxID=6305 RepID=A0A1I8B6C5_MELHA
MDKTTTKLTLVNFNEEKKVEDNLFSVRPNKRRKKRKNGKRSNHSIGNLIKLVVTNTKQEDTEQKNCSKQLENNRFWPIKYSTLLIENEENVLKVEEKFGKVEDEEEERKEIMKRVEELEGDEEEEEEDDEEEEEDEDDEEGGDDEEEEDEEEDDDEEKEEDDEEMMNMNEEDWKSEINDAEVNKNEEANNLKINENEEEVKRGRIKKFELLKIKEMCCNIYSLFDTANAFLGDFIARHPVRHIFASVCFLIVLSLQLINMDIEYDIRASFSPLNSKSMREASIYKEFFNLTTSPQRAFMLFKAKDGGTMLREEHLREVLQLDSELDETLSLRDSKTGMLACEPLCNLNRPFHLIAQNLINNSSSSSFLKLDHPFSHYFGSPLFVGSNLFGVVTKDDISSQNDILSKGDISSKNISKEDLNNSINNKNNIIYVRTIILWYFSRADTKENIKQLRNVTLNLFEESQRGKRFKFVQFQIFGDEIANREMIRGAIQATVLMSIGLLLLLIFVSFVVYRKMSGLVTTPAIALIVLISILCPLLSTVAAFGFSTWLGNRIYTLMCVTPFLIAGVGVDDAFIMLQSWQQHKDIKCLKQRLSKVLVHIGPSITITSLTNTTAFGIGYFTPAPTMSLFCLCTSLLAPVLVLLSTHFPTKQTTSLIPQQECNEKPLIALMPPLPSIPTSRAFQYAKFIHSSRGRVSAFLLAIILYIVGTSGVLRFKSTFEPSKAFPSDSPLAHSLDSVGDVFNEFFPLCILVNRPPNLTDYEEYSTFNNMLSELEALPESWGSNRTLLWLRPYEEFDRKNNHFWQSLGFGPKGNYKFSLDNLPFFLNSIGNPPTVKFEKTRNGSINLKAFQFSIVNKGMTEWWNRAVMEEKVRAVLEKYEKRFNASMFDADSPILNMLLTVKIDLIGSIAVTVVCMVLICSLFIAHPAGVCIIGICISSICFTLVGTLSWCGADLDPITMVDVLLATGFSVDYTAHIAHQYYTKQGSSIERIAQSLDGISTALCMVPLVFLPTYAIIFAVVSIGLLHGLFFLPVMLCALPESKREQTRLRTSTNQIPPKTKNSKETSNNNGVVIIGEREGI